MSPSSLGTRLRGRGVTPGRAARWVVRLASGCFSNDLPQVRVPSDRANVVTSRHNQRP